MRRLSPALAPLCTGIERADSLTFDFHKWMFVQFGASCVLVRDPARHRRTFTREAAYLAGQTRILQQAPPPFSELGMALSRPFRALRIWVALKEFGVRRYAQMIEQDVAQARYLAARVQATPELELLAPVATTEAIAPSTVPRASSLRAGTRMLSPRSKSSPRSPEEFDDPEAVADASDLLVALDAESWNAETRRRRHHVRHGQGAV